MSDDSQRPVASADTTALIEEARRWHHSRRVQVGTKTHGGPNQYEDKCSYCGCTWPCATSRLVDALKAEVARSKELTDRIEALAELAVTRRMRNYDDGFSEGFVQESEIQRLLVTSDTKEATE